MTASFNTTLELQRHRALLEVLEVLSRASHSVSDVVGAVHEQAGRVIDAHVTVLAVRVEDGWLCDLLQSNERLSRRVPYLGRGLSEQVFEGAPLRVPDVDAYLAQHGLVIRHLDGPGSPPRVRAYLGVPLHIEGARAGVLSLQSYHPDAFSDLDLHFLELLGKHVSLALDHAHLRERLEQQARTDGLTGLLNRHAFHDVARGACARAGRFGTPLSLVMIDVQQFKRINDDFGHAAGDAVLCGLARALQEAVRAQDHVFRLGGDEFALLLECDAPGARCAVRRAHAALARQAWPSGLQGVHPNAGVAEWNPDEPLEDWLRRADHQMYDAKKRGQLLLDDSP